VTPRPLLVALAAAVGVALVLPACAQVEPTVTLTIRHSQFSTASVRARPGATVRFVVHNADPIAHELIVGDRSVQDAHEAGTEAHHGGRPGEVTVEAGATAVTSFRVGRVTGDGLLFGCHLPGHWAYGMHGTIRVG